MGRLVYYAVPVYTQSKRNILAGAACPSHPSALCLTAFLKELHLLKLRKEIFNRLPNLRRMQVCSGHKYGAYKRRQKNNFLRENEFQERGEKVRDKKKRQEIPHVHGR